jgi:hypothetical protein
VSKAAAVVFIALDKPVRAKLLGARSTPAATYPLHEQQCGHAQGMKESARLGLAKPLREHQPQIDPQRQSELCRQTRREGRQNERGHLTARV